MRHIPESDWKKLRKIKDKMINTSCRNIFKKLMNFQKTYLLEKD